MKKILTLCIPIKDDKVILGMKKRGFGVGRWNGFGGKIEQGETIEQGAMRELTEEAGINDGVLQKMGVLEFSFQNDEKILEVHIFKLTDFNQEPVESEEMKPEWIIINGMPLPEWDKLSPAEKARIRKEYKQKLVGKQTKPQSLESSSHPKR